MPISPPRLDDRNFDDLVEELLARIPAHTPEWVPQPGDPGRTLIELFAWLGETILYRANLIPERQRLAFLKLLGEPMRAAVAAQGLVSISLNEPEASDVVHLAAGATVSGAVKFETGTELAVLPVTAECYYKREHRKYSMACVNFTKLKARCPLTSQLRLSVRDWWTVQVSI
jgi:predicted phage baseplate assembly protein